MSWLVGILVAFAGAMLVDYGHNWGFLLTLIGVGICFTSRP